MTNQYTVLCLGDLIVDVWWSVDTAVKNVEHAAMALVSSPSQQEVAPGGVGIVASALSSLNVSSAVLTAVDESTTTGLALNKLNLRHVATHLVRSSRDFSTPVKTRYINVNGHILMRHDAEQVVADAPDAYSADYVQQNLTESVKCLAVSDYGKNGVPAAVRDTVVSIAKLAGKPLYVDAKPKYFNKYVGADVFKINMAEFNHFAATDMRDQPIDLAIQATAQRLQTKLLIVTDGPSGAYYCHNCKQTSFIRSPASYRVGNCVGAGDVFFAGIIFGFSQLGSYDPAQLDDDAVFKLIQFGLSSACEYVKLGSVYAPTPATVLKSVLPRNAPIRRLMPIKEFIQFAAAQKKAGQRVVFTNGCFDLLHSGHIELLTAAKREGDVLLVAVDSDDNVARLKGFDRPVQDERTRAGNIAALDVVDAVCIFQDTSKNTYLEQLVKHTAPDVLVKGADYQGTQVVGASSLRRQNPPGRVVFVPLVPNSSTTAFVNKMKAARK